MIGVCRLWAILTLLVFGACGGENHTNVNDAGADVLYLTTLSDPGSYAQVAGAKGEIKYLLRVDGRTPPDPLEGLECIFQDSRRFPFHIQFLHEFKALADLDFDTYLNLVLRRSSRVWWGGALKLWPSVPHPSTGLPGLITYTVYSESANEELPTVDDLTQAYTRLSRCVPYASSLLALYGDSPAQIAHYRTLLAELNARAISVAFPEHLAATGGMEGYSVGEGYGYLRIVPKGQTLRAVSPRDVVIVEGAPVEISVVAGLVTANPQSTLSHVNLRLQEKKIPNGSWRQVFDSPLIAKMEGGLVRLVVESDRITIEPARLIDAEAFWKARRPQLPSLVADLSVRPLARFADLKHENFTAYGVKAANIAELRRALPAANRVDGFGIPFSRYADHVGAPLVAQKMADVLADPKLRLDAVHKAVRLKELRDAIRKAPISAAFLSEVKAQAVAVFGPGVATLPLRFRSSTNVEDLPGLSGAGLYDSKRGCLADDEAANALGSSLCLSASERSFLESDLARRQAELAMHPDRTWLADVIKDITGDLNEKKTVADAVRKVWASLWNDRAFDDREYYGLDHTKVFMGVAVNPSFVLEKLEAVAVTELSVDAGAPLYRVVSQLGSIGVVQPIDPTAVAETLTFRRGESGAAVDVKRLVSSSLANPPDTNLWSPPMLAELARHLIAIHDHFAAHVYSTRPLNLDVEIELTADDRIVLKQARPFVGGR